MQMKYAIAVADTKSMNEAARSLFITQPSLSASVKELENEIHISMKNVSADELNFNVDEITDRFVRGDSSRNTEGSGLGLAIAKSFVELQHGRLKISTEADLFKADIVLPKTEPPEENENLKSV